MCHTDYGTRELGQKLLKPLNTFGIQVVGGFVKQQHIWLGKQQTAQRDTALFSAGEFADVRLPGRQTQRIGCDFHLRFHVVRTARGRSRYHGFKLSLFRRKLVKIRIGFSIGGIDFIESFFGCHDGAQPLFYRLAHRVLSVQFGLLLKVSNIETRHRYSFALDLFVNARHDFQQR